MVTVITKTIGPSGDYASFTAAEADVVNIATAAFKSEDLVANDGAIVFEADAATYSEYVTFDSTLITDATRNVTYKPAAGSEHGGVSGAGVVINASAFMVLRDDYMLFDGMEVNGSATQTFNIQQVTGATIRNCIVNAATQGLVIQSGAVDIAIENCVLSSSNYTIYPNASSGTISVSVRNCTVKDGPAALSAIRIAQSGTATISAEFVNHLHLQGAGGAYIATGTVTVTGSNNFGGSTNPFPVALQGSPYPITASTSYDPGAGDYALYVASNGALLDSPNNDVIGKGLSFLDGAGDVPGYDIQGNPRGANISNPGAFEIPQGPTVVTKTIGPGRDYISFTDAEADVESIATLEFGSTDLVASNGAIVFEADAGLYEESVTFLSGLTTDQTRNVTYKAAAGSEHKGEKTAGVIVTSNAYTGDARDDHTHLRGIVFLSSDIHAIILRGDGCSAFDCIAETTVTGSNSYPIHLLNAGTASAPLRVENCVASCPQGSAYFTFDNVSDTHAFLTNCTGIVYGGSVPVFRFFPSGTNIYATVTNCLAFDLSGTGACQPNTTTFSGSNNFGSSVNPWPVALQGSPYPITPTTDTDPGPGDWAIYDAATGALIDDPDNDVLGGGVGPDADADVPTTDIVGNIRSGDTTDPGAFQRPALDTIMRQIYQQDAPFAIGASPSGASGITHQLGPASADYFTINSTTSATITVPRTAHAMRIACVNPSKSCDVTLELDASNSVYLGTIGGIASVQADIDYFWSFASVASDGAYPRVKIEYDGVFSGDQLVYLWWHLA
jgi:hypothetical protein